MWCDDICCYMLNIFRVRHEAVDIEKTSNSWYVYTGTLDSGTEILTLWSNKKLYMTNKCGQYMKTLVCLHCTRRSCIQSTILCQQIVSYPHHTFVCIDEQIHRRSIKVCSWQWVETNRQASHWCCDMSIVMIWLQLQFPKSFRQNYNCYSRSRARAHSHTHKT